MTAQPWDASEVPDLTGRRAVVTGVTSGLGEETAFELARAGAEVVLTGRRERRLQRVVADIERRVPGASLAAEVMDLADLSSVRRAAARAATYGPVDILVNNAGVMATPHRRTVDGFELQLATNHLGHFALTGLLLPQLVASGNARVVTVSSLMHRLARTVPLGDLRVPPRRYNRWTAYAQSKLGNLLFCFELDRRCRRAGLPITSVAAHPGYAATNLVPGGLHLGGRTAQGTILEGVTKLLAQSAADGAAPLLMAATLPDLPGSTYLGPGGPGEVRGAPKVVGTSRVAQHEGLAARFWELSQDATGLTYP